MKNKIYCLSFSNKIYALSHNAFYISMSYGRRKIMHCPTMHFISPCPTVVSCTKENYHGASVSCYSDDLVQMLPCLDFYSLGSKNRLENKFMLVHVHM